jgi:hypothetical protein
VISGVIVSATLAAKIPVAMRNTAHLLVILVLRRVELCSSSGTMADWSYSMVATGVLDRREEHVGVS